MARLRRMLPGLVLVRQKPGSAKGVMFVTVEDETGVANLVVWPSVFERQRRLALSAGMLACHGRVRREGEVVHVVADRLEDLSGLLRSVGGRTGDADAFPPRHGRGGGVAHPGAPDARDGGAGPGGGRPAGGISTLDPRPGGGGIRVPPRDFR